jgi:ParB family chromosome partitioning protein
MSKKPLRFNVNPLLSGPTLEARTRSGSPYRELDIDEIDFDPEQPRREFDAEKLAELASSIKEHGLINPIMVRLLPGGSYRLVAGERRLRSFKLLGRKTIPAVIDQQEEGKELLSKQLVENLQRADLSPMEKSDAIARLRDEHGFSVRDLAARLGISKSAVQRALDIQMLPPELKAALRNGAPESKILLLAQIEDPKLRTQMLEKIDSLSREDLQNRGDKVSHGGTKGSKSKKARPADERLVGELQRQLGLRVGIQRNPKKAGQGKLVVEFYSEADLETIITKLGGSEERRPTVGH